MNSEPTREQQSQIVQRAVDALREHFDTVQIFVTKVEGDNTLNCENGAGDWFARYGMVRQWQIVTEQRIKSKATSELNEQ